MAPEMPIYTVGTWVVEHATQQVCQVVAIETTATNRPSYNLSSGSVGLHENELDEILRVRRCDVYSYAEMCHMQTVFFAVTHDESLPIPGGIATAISLQQLARAVAKWIREAATTSSPSPNDVPPF